MCERRADRRVDGQTGRWTNRQVDREREREETELTQSALNAYSPFISVKLQLVLCTGTSSMDQRIRRLKVLIDHQTPVEHQVGAVNS